MSEHQQPPQSDKQRIFRQVALERLSTPEQLDQMVSITGSVSWIAAAVLWAFLVAVGVASFVIEIPTYVMADGILVNKGGSVFDVSAPTKGRVSRLSVQVGDYVSSGEIIGVVDQSQLKLDAELAREIVSERETHKANLVELFERERAINEDNQSNIRENLKQTLAATSAQRDFLKERVTSLEGLEKKGLITRSKLAAARAEFHAAEQKIRVAKTEIVALDQGTHDLTARQNLKIWEVEQSLQNGRRKLQDLTFRLGQAQTLKAAVSGQVIEIKAPVGVLVEAGHSVVSLIQGGNGYEAIVFVPPDKGKDIRPGLKVDVQPIHIRKEEFGAVVGAVTNVSAFPISPERMRAILRNDNLVGKFSATGASYMARVSLETDSNTTSGFRWTSGAGPDSQISSGSIVSTEIAVRYRTPIEMVFPLLRKYTGFGF